jgi:hypothetical protein
MSMRAVFLIPAILVLAACGPTEVDADGDGQISEVEAETARNEMVKPQPGKYRLTQTLVNMESSTTKEWQQERLKAMMAAAQPQVSEICLTEEEAQSGFAQMFSPNASAEACEVKEFNMNGGEFDAVMICNDGPFSGRVRLDGYGSRTSSQAQVTIESESGDGVTSTMTLELKRERIGDCDV